MNRFPVNKIFTPNTPATVTFVERSKDLTERLNGSLNALGKPIVVCGQAGAGKFTLLIKKIEELYDNHIVSSCENVATIEQLTLDALDQLGGFYLAETKNSSSKARSNKIGVKILSTDSIKSSADEDKLIRDVPSQPGPRRVAQLLNEQDVCWIIRGIQCLGPQERSSLAGMIKAFMDLSHKYASRVIVIGTAEDAQTLIGDVRDIESRVCELYVPAMSKSEVMKILDKGERALNIRFHTELKNIIVDCANGSAAVCHDLALAICSEKRIFETCDDVVVLSNGDRAIEKYLNKLENRATLHARSIDDDRNLIRLLQDRRRLDDRRRTKQQKARDDRRKGDRRKNLEKRTTPRYSFQLPVDYQIADMRSTGQLRDLSETGASILGLSACKPDDRIRIELHNFDTSKAVWRSGIVRWIEGTHVTQNGQQYSAMFGLRFARKLSDSPNCFFPLREVT